MYTLKLNNDTLATSPAWNPSLFAGFTNTSFPRSIPDGYAWTNDAGYSIAQVPDPEPDPLTPEQLREIAKAQRAAAVEAITVTTQAGNTFDGDETSQTRMARAIIALQATGTPSVNWVLSDNTVIDATAAELTEALALSGAAQAAIWVIE